MKKKFVAVFTAFILTSQPAFASVLGTEIKGWSHDIAFGADVYNTEFMSTQSGVGKQTEYYAKYTPNEKVTPTVISGESLWGRKTIKEVEEYMENNGMVPLIGINASYFSLQTGLPMGHVISDGKVISKDTENYESIGFLPSGEAFIAPLSITAELKKDDLVIDIAHINKYNQEVIDIVNLYTTDYGDSNHSEVSALTLILGEASGDIKIGKEITAKVEEKFIYDSSIKIPDGKIVLTLNETGKPELFEALNSLEVGDEVTISANANDERWGAVDSALGSVGETLIKDGKITEGLPSGTAPRTAVGITSSGEVIFYVLDGRRPGHSYGAKLESLAKRLLELGCVSAINLDGGGSSVISGIFPGNDASAIINTPSDGVPRKCANYIFLQNNEKKTGILDKLHIYPFSEHYLVGYEEQLEVLATDTAYHKVETPKNLEFYTAGTESTINENGVFLAKGTGPVTATVVGDGASGEAEFYTYETPTNIDVYNEESKNISSLVLEKGDSVKLTMKAQYNDIALKVNQNSFKLELSDDFGYIENNTLFITKAGKSGILKVSAGDYTKEIPITVNKGLPFADIGEHWAKDNILEVFKLNIISGYDENGEMVFKPDNNMTREEFSVIVSRLLDTDTEKYKDFDLSRFADADALGNWSKAHIASLVDKNLITGKSDGEKLNFAPKDNLTRAEAMTILGRIIGESEETFEFSDVADIPVWSKGYISKMVALGVISGYEDNTIRPLSNIKRGEVVTLINKLLKALEN